MKLIRSLMGRREFLITAGVTSTSALAFKKLAGEIVPYLQSDVAKAADKTVTASTRRASKSYSHLLSPLRIRNAVLKNRMLYTVSTPHFLQGPETWPAEIVRSYYAGVAKNAAIVTVRMSNTGRIRKEQTGDSAHMAIWDGEDPAVTNYVDQMIEGVHSMGSLVSGGSLGSVSRAATPATTAPGASAPAATTTQAQATVKIEDIVAQAKKLETQGIDVVTMGGRNLQVQDKDALRAVIEQMQAVRNATNLIIMTSVMVLDPVVSRPMPNYPETVTGLSIDEAIEMTKMFEGSADILFMKVAGGMANHPSGYNQDKGKPVILPYAQAIKESGVKIITCPNGGFRDPDENEEYIASGKTDMIAMARPFISEPDYVKKTYEGRSEDMVPCIMCNKCHGGGQEGPWISVCSVNPKLGLSTALQVIDAPSVPKQVAVIGGGPGGMKAALTAAERGHKVTLYEKSDTLGGLLKHADFSPYKWPHKNFKDYLVRQVKKSGIELLLNTEATPEMIKRKEYDAVLVAAGSEPVIPKIPGADGKSVWNVVNVYGKEKSIGKSVVIVGGGQFSVETGLYLASAGHDVTVLASEKQLMDFGGPHHHDKTIDMADRLDNFSFVLEATTTSISDGKVTYKDAKGSEKSLQADSVVVYAGLRPRLDEAMKFSGSANQFSILGDCTGNAGNIQKAIRSAFFTASQV